MLLNFKKMSLNTIEIVTGKHFTVLSGIIEISGFKSYNNFDFKVQEQNLTDLGILNFG